MSLIKTKLKASLIIQFLPLLSCLVLIIEISRAYIYGSHLIREWSAAVQHQVMLKSIQLYFTQTMDQLPLFEFCYQKQPIDTMFELKNDNAKLYIYRCGNPIRLDYLIIKQ